MIRAVIVDDEKNSCDIVELMLQKYYPAIEVTGRAGCCSEGIVEISRYRPDILFLDLEMPDGNGFDLLRGVESLDFEVIFITAYERNFLLAIRFSEVDVILKPVDRGSFRSAVDAALIRINERSGRERYHILLSNVQLEEETLKIGLSAPDGLIFFPVKEVVWIEQQEDKTCFYPVQQQKVVVGKNFRYYSELFSSLNYFQVNNTQMINLLHAEAIHPREAGVRLTNGVELKVSSRRMGELSDRMKQLNHISRS